MLLRTLCVLLLVVSGHSNIFPFPFPFPNPHFGLDDPTDDTPIETDPFKGSGADPDPFGADPFETKPDVDSVETKLDPDQIKTKPVKSNFKGKWELFTDNSGVSAMHLILLPKVNKVLIFDSTIWLKSNIKLDNPCRVVDEGKGPVRDCYAHAVLLDIETASLTPLRLHYDTWCSSGALSVDGTLVSTGGFRNGSDTARYLGLCDDCQWREYPGTLANGRWYSTQVTLADGRFMVFGGRESPTYEFLPTEGQRNTKPILFPFLVETKDPVENNLYPFVYLSTDGNLFVFANNRSILLNPNTQKIVYEFPVLPGGSRNYPASASSVLLPIVLRPNENRARVKAEVLICGGAQHDAFYWADQHKPKIFNPAIDDCGRIDITTKKPAWKIEKMPSRRILGDAMILPTGDVLLLNGAKAGSAGWDDAREPNFTPVMYRKSTTERFRELNPSKIARLYHSTSALLPDGKIMVAGSNTNNGYVYDALFPTELRVEKFSPPYLDPVNSKWRVEIVEEGTTTSMKYGNEVTVQVSTPLDELDKSKIQVTMYAPAFTTHGISMNQRLVQLGVVEITNDVAGTYNIVATGPPSGNIAPPGYYMLFVVHKGVPSVAVWVQIK
ncbi:hypothetical protein SLE2022_160430 [Rubroshorea leprosula]